jgi:hypothetical protein
MACQASRRAAHLAAESWSARPLRVSAALTLAASVLASCSAPRGAWDGSVGRWGTLREALRDGHSEARVEVASAVRSPYAIGLGAAAGLDGEITVLDGVVHVSRGTAEGALASSRGDGSGLEATLLALARVERWRYEPLAASGDRSALEADVQRAIERAGFERLPCVPFVVRGDLAGLRGHVLRGACPKSSTPPPAGSRPPLELRLDRARGTLVGFWTTLPAGELTHHGERTHVHVLLEDGTTAHVDEIGTGPTAVLALPDLSR